MVFLQVNLGWTDFSFMEAQLYVLRQFLEDVLVWEEPDNELDQWVADFLPLSAFSLSGGMPRLSEDDSFSSQVRRSRILTHV